MSTIAQLETVSIDDIRISDTNPRKTFDENKLNELAESIKEHGVLQPILIRKTLNGSKPYELVSGERRYRATIIAGIDSIPANIRSLSDEEAFELQIIENLERADVSPMDEARAFKSLMNKETIDWLSSKIHKSKKYVLDRIKLLDLCDEGINLLEIGLLPLGHAALLSKIDKEKQIKIIKSNLISGTVGKSVGSKMVYDYSQAYCTMTLNTLKNTIYNETMLSFSDVNFDLNDEKLLPNAGSCANCLKRTINHNILFQDITDKDKCTDSICYNAKIKKQTEVSVEAAKKQYGEILTGEKEQWSSSGVIVKKEKYYYKTEPSPGDLPVVITKADKWNSAVLGKVVWITPKDNTEKPAVNNSGWREETKKEHNTIFYPRIQKMAEHTKSLSSEILEPICKAFLLKEFFSQDIEFLITVCNSLGIETGVESDYDAIDKFEDSLDWNAKQNFKYELGLKLTEFYPIHMVMNVLVMLKVADDPIQDYKEKRLGEIKFVDYLKWIGLELERTEFDIDDEEEEEDDDDFDDADELYDSEPFIDEFFSKKSEEKTCRVCGCTDNDCSQCIEKTGLACHWIEDDLCSACQEINDIEVEEEKPEVKKENPKSKKSNKKA